MPKATGQEAIAAALHADFNNPEGPESRPDVDEEDPVVSAFEEPPDECGMHSLPEGVGEPPPEAWVMQPPS